MRRPGFALVWVVLAMALAVALLGVIWSQAADSRVRARRLLAAARARLLERGALAHGLHKVEKTVAYFDDRLAQGRRVAYDVGKEDPAFLEDLRGRVEFADGHGSYRVVAMQVTRQETVRGEGVLKVAMAAEVAIEAGGDRRRERTSGEFRLFSGVGGGGAP